MEFVGDRVAVGFLACNMNINHYYRDKLEKRKSFQCSTCTSGWGGSSPHETRNLTFWGFCWATRKRTQLPNNSIHFLLLPSQNNKIWIIWTCVAKKSFSIINLEWVSDSLLRMTCFLPKKVLSARMSHKQMNSCYTGIDILYSLGLFLKVKE